jgi:hypothetical protein
LRHFGSEASPAVFGSVLLRLQHGCSMIELCVLAIQMVDEYMSLMPRIVKDAG